MDNAQNSTLYRTFIKIWSDKSRYLKFEFTMDFNLTYACLCVYKESLDNTDSSVKVWVETGETHQQSENDDDEQTQLNDFNEVCK